MKKYLTVSFLLGYAIVDSCQALHQVNRMDSNQDNAQTSSSFSADLRAEKSSIRVICKRLIDASLYRTGYMQGKETLLDAIGKMSYEDICVLLKDMLKNTDTETILCDKPLPKPLKRKLIDCL